MWLQPGAMLRDTAVYQRLTKGLRQSATPAMGPYDVAAWLRQAMSGRVHRSPRCQTRPQLCDCRNCMDDLEYGLRTMHCVLEGCSLSDEATDSSSDEDPLGGCDAGQLSDEEDRVRPQHCGDQACVQCSGTMLVLP